MRILLGAVVALLALLAVLPYAAPLSVFRPTPLQPADPAHWGLPQATQTAFTAPDGSRIVGWWIAPPEPGAPVLLIAHGRSANMSTRAPVVARLAAGGFGVLLFDYRGYGASEGSPSERGINEDAIAAYDWLRRKGVAPSRIVLIGQSLGNMPAAHVASLRPAAALVLVSPFTSLPGALADRYPWLKPLPWPRNRFDVAERLRKVRAPLVLIVGERDELVPVANARRLVSMQKRRVRWLTIEGGGHNGLLAKVVETGRLQAVLDEVLTRKNRSGGKKKASS